MIQEQLNIKKCTLCIVENTDREYVYYSRGILPNRRYYLYMLNLSVWKQLIALQRIVNIVLTWGKKPTKKGVMSDERIQLFKQAHENCGSCS